PAVALKSVLGEFSTEILSSARVIPEVLETSGFTWQDTPVESAIRAALS
ncbi:MAG: DUF1731 domain-containing protein, partial [Actinomycetota bacterium]|nr:DUF1731 domain-containing protein [Actinomycetota bacterium]